MHSSSISQVQYQEFPQFNVFHLWNAQSKLPLVDLVFLQHEGKKRQYTKKDRSYNMKEKRDSIQRKTG